MRIRSIHPEFWRSEDVAALDWEARLVFIGLWSYVDDNGVGRDVEKLITGDLFSLDDDSRESVARVSRGLAALSEGGQITRYTVDGKPYLHIAAWLKWQKIDRPGKGRYPLLTCDNAEIRDTLATLSRESIEPSATGEGEKGRRGEVKDSPAPARAVASETDAAFARWYESYPRKTGKGAAVKAYRTARKKADEDTLLDAIRRQASHLMAGGVDYCPHPATWLNGERWADEAPRADVVQLLPSGEVDPASLPPVEESWMHRRRT